MKELTTEELLENLKNTLYLIERIGTAYNNLYTIPLEEDELNEELKESIEKVLDELIDIQNIFHRNTRALQREILERTEM